MTGDPGGESISGRMEPVAITTWLASLGRGEDFQRTWMSCEQIEYKDSYHLYMKHCDILYKFNTILDYDYTRTNMLLL